MRRAPLEKSRDGLMKDHCTSILTRNHFRPQPGAASRMMIGDFSTIPQRSSKERKMNENLPSNPNLTKSGLTRRELLWKASAAAALGAAGRLSFGQANSAPAPAPGTGKGFP